MQEKDTLSQMADIKFDAPLDIKVVFDESDEEEDVLRKQKISRQAAANPAGSDRCISPTKQGSLDPIKRIEETTKRTFQFDNPNEYEYKRKKNKTPPRNNKNPGCTENNMSNSSLKIAMDELLYTFIDHIMYIIRAHQTYVIIPYRNSDRGPNFQKSYQHFRTLKYRFFELSYGTAKTLLDPIQNDKAFVINLISKIQQKAASENSHYSFEQIQMLLKDIVIWTKNQKHFLQNLKFTNNTYDYQSIKSRSEEFKELHPSNNHHNLAQATTSLLPGTKNSFNNEQTKCLFSHGPKHNSIEINVDTSILNTYLNQTKTKCRESEIRNEVNMPKEINISQRPNLMQQRNNAENTICSDVLCKQNINDYSLKDLLNQPPVVRPVLPSYHDVLHDIVESSKQFSTKEKPFSALEEPTYYVETNRSNSTDSGFVSPLTFQNHEPLPTNHSGDLQQHSMTPYITHVTSLNPDAKHFKHGLCFVCNKITNKMCIGCYKYFYCGHDCQSRDWKTHKYFCSNTGRPPQN